MTDILITISVGKLCREPGVCLLQRIQMIQAWGGIGTSHLVSLTHLLVKGLICARHWGCIGIQPIHEAKEETYAHNKQVCVCIIFDCKKVINCRIKFDCLSFYSKISHSNLAVSSRHEIKWLPVAFEILHNLVLATFPKLFFFLFPLFSRAHTHASNVCRGSEDSL